MRRLRFILNKTFRRKFSKRGESLMKYTTVNLMLIFAVISLVSFSAEASTYIQDAGSNAAFVQRSDNGNWADMLGNKAFESYGFEYTQTGNNLEIKIFSNYPQSGYTGGNGVSWHTTPGDFMIDVNLDGTYEYALALVGHNDPSIPDGINDGTVSAGQLYQISSLYLASAYMPAGFTGYYGTNWRLESSPATTRPAYVRANGTNIVGTTAVSWYAYPTPSPDNRITFTLDTTDFLPAGFTGDIGVYWSTATCANDVIVGNIHLSSDENVPEPGTWLMMASGLVGLTSFLRKRNVNNKKA